MTGREPERRLGWRGFLRSADSLVRVSAAVDETPWTSKQISEEEGGLYLCKVEHRWLRSDGDSFSPSAGDGAVLYKFEWHILYSASYQMPVLYFSVCDQSGITVSWDWLCRRLPRQLLAQSQQSQPDQSEDQLYQQFGQMVTQTMHPIFGSPFFSIHPCRTSHLMGQLAGCVHCQGQAPSSSSSPESDVPCTYLITWLSSVAPVAGLSLPNEYGSLVAK